MRLEDFITIIQIHSIENSVYQHQHKIEEHKKRQEFIIKQKNDAQNELEQALRNQDELEKEISKNEKELFSYQSRFKQAKNHIKDISNVKEEHALNFQIQTLTPQIANLEEIIFSDLEKLESIETIIEKKKKFVQGVEDSISTVEKEVEKDCLKEEEQISLYKNQRKNLLETINPELRNTYINLRNKFRTTPPISFITNKSCSRCGLQIDNAKENGLEVKFTLELCNGCGRLLIPTSASSNQFKP